MAPKKRKQAQKTVANTTEKTKKKKQQPKKAVGEGGQHEETVSLTSSSSDDGPLLNSDTEEEGGDAHETIDVDFECCDPGEDDFHSIKMLLTHYLDGRQYASSELVEAIIDAQASSVIKCGDGEEAIGVAAVLPCTPHSPAPYEKELVKFILDSSKGGDDVKKGKKLVGLWEKPGSALLVSERLMNCPPQLAPPLLESLIEECSGSDIKRLVFLTRAYEDVKEKELIFATPEGEFLAAHAEVSFDFPVANRTVVAGGSGSGGDKGNGGDLVPKRVAMVVNMGVLESGAVVREMQACLNT